MDRLSKLLNINEERISVPEDRGKFSRIQSRETKKLKMLKGRLRNL